MSRIWFAEYATSANGLYLYQPQLRRRVIECDSSLEAGGGHDDTNCYHWRYTCAHVKKYSSIHELEAINIVVAYKTLTSNIAGLPFRVIIKTDNISSAYVLQNGRTRDNTLASCARELWLLAAANSHEVTVAHKPGEELVFADALSRMHSDCEKYRIVYDHIHAYKFAFVHPKVEGYKFFHTSL